MMKRDAAIRLADRYDIKDLEPDVDPKKVAAFLDDNKETPKKEPNAARPAQNAYKPVRTKEPKIATKAIKPKSTIEVESKDNEPWTSRTIRLRQSTATALTKAACGQKSIQAEGQLRPGQPVTVQEIAELGIRLALIELGYSK